MTPQKALAIQIAGIKPRFPHSPHEADNEQKFDRLWPSLQAQYLAQAARVMAARRGDG